MLANLEEVAELQQSENRILRQKLQSKCEAVAILTQELDHVKNECDDYRQLVERLHSAPGGLGCLVSEAAARASRALFSDSVVSTQMLELREENKRLLVERENLRRALQDQQEDVRLLRQQLNKEKCARKALAKDSQKAKLLGNDSFSQQKSSVELLELLQTKCQRLKLDLQSLLDEKEDLVQERDAYKCKIHRLNHVMGVMLKADTLQHVDLDSLLSENRFLKDSLQQVRNEKQLANEMGRRYKSALEACARHDQAQHQGSSTAAMHAQLLSLIRKTSFPCPKELDLSNVDSLQQVCVSLLETLNDRMLQLKHQRKANKHIMDRLGLLEKRIMDSNGNRGEMILWPSQFLIKGYCESSVDSEASDAAAAAAQLLLADAHGAASTSTLAPGRPTTHLPPRCCSSSEHEADSTDELPEHLQKLVDDAMCSLDNLICDAKEGADDSTSSGHQ